MTTAQEHERKLVISFILPARQSRYFELFEKPKRRNDIIGSLAHFKHLDERIRGPNYLARAGLVILKTKIAGGS
jgi:hypothetical protein